MTNTVSSTLPVNNVEFDIVPAVRIVVPNLNAAALEEAPTVSEFSRFENDTTFVVLQVGAACAVLNSILDTPNLHAVGAWSVRGKMVGNTPFVKALCEDDGVESVSVASLDHVFVTTRHSATKLEAIMAAQMPATV